MSCATLNQQAVKLAVSVGSLPEGYCPTSLQVLANDIAARLIVTPSNQFSSFVAGSEEPVGNQGPWLKDCEEWWFFNDETGRYEPSPKDGFNAISAFTANGTFTVPANITKIMIQAWGGGGGGGDDSGGQPGNGGGGGSYGLAIRDVTSGSSIPVVVGTGGAGGAAGSAGANGGNTTILGMTAGGGLGGPSGASTVGGNGGTSTGFDVNMPGQPGSRATAGNGGWGGDAGGGGGGGGAFFGTIAHANGVFPGGAGSGDFVSNLGTGNGAAGLVIIFY